MSKPLLLAVSSALVLWGCAGPLALEPAPPAPSAQPAPLVVKLIAFNDFHGHLESPGTLRVAGASAVPVGGADYLAAHIARLRSQSKHSVVVSAGDSIGASPLVSSLFFDEPTVEALNLLGLEFNSVGNHEFDKGADELKRLQYGGCRTGEANSCRRAKEAAAAPFEGAKFRWLAANVIEQASNRPLLPAYGTKRFEGVDIAVIGVTLEGTPTIVTPSGVRGLEFRDEAETVNRLIPELKAQGIEAVILLLHEGGVQRGSNPDINGCEGQLDGSPLAAIVRRLDDAVDLVVSGHTHAAYNCRLPNARGREVPVTSAGAFGRVLTDVELSIHRTSRDVVSVGAVNRVVRRDEPGLLPDPAVVRLVEGYRTLAARLAGQVIGAVADDVPNTRVDAACNMPAGSLIADAMLAATEPPAAGGAQIALMNAGGVRSPGFTFRSSAAGEGDGQVTFGEAFTVQPFGNDLVTLTLPAQDLKTVLEEQFAGCGKQPPGNTRLMLPSAGFHYSWDGSRACGERVRSVTLRRGNTYETIVDAKGQVIEPSRPYRVTINNYMAEGGDGFSTFLNGSQRRVGQRDVDALVQYMARYRAPATPWRPGSHSDDAGPRIRRLAGGTACPTGADTNP